MRPLIAALLLSLSTPAFADNIADCEVVLMETIEQEDSEGVTEIASFRPAIDFIASAYDDDIEVLREIDGLAIRALMCKRQSVVPGESDFPIVATGTPFMISQNFDSAETGLTTIYFKDGEFRSTYKGPEMTEEISVQLEARLQEFNAQPHSLAEKEKAMLEKSALEETPQEESTLEERIEEKSTETEASEDDTLTESTEKDDVLAEEPMEAISPEVQETLK